MPLYPLPCIVQLVIFLGIFLTTESTLLYDSEAPVLELSIAFLFIGAAIFKLTGGNMEVSIFKLKEDLAAQRSN